jgi:hypothetical protein
MFNGNSKFLLLYSSTFPAYIQNPLSIRAPSPFLYRNFLSLGENNFLLPQPTVLRISDV